MNVYAILQEPASYTVDRNCAVYEPLGIHYSYMYGQSEAKATATDNVQTDCSLSELSFFTLVSRLWRILKENEVIIMNGYANKYFAILFILNMY